MNHLPPQAIEIEKAVLGALLTRPCPGAKKMLIPEMFYREAHQTIYRCIESIEGEVDILIVAEALKKQGKLAEVGGAYYISKLPNNTFGNVDQHVHIIAEKYIKRLYIQYSAEIQRTCYDDSTDVFEVQGMVTNLFREIDYVVASGGGAKHIKEIIARAHKEFEERIHKAKTNEQTGINTGLDKLNNILCGWQNSDLIIQAARPGMGKTAMALHHANAAAMQGKSVCMYSLEMSDVRLVDRMILKTTGIDAYRYKTGKIDAYEMEQYHTNIGKLEKLKIYIDDNPIVSMDYIMSNAAVMHQQGMCDMVIIDYLQLAEMEKTKGKSREQEVSEASRKAKIIAKNLDVPVLLLSQLNRSVETRGGDKRPTLSDLRDSGAIEQDADVVMFIYRPSYYGIKEDSEGNSTYGYGELIVAKHRNGALDTVSFWHNDSMTDINDYQPKYQETPF